jgi:hypothetical protein
LQQVLERYVQRQSALLSEQAQERVRVELAVHDPQQRQVVSVALRVVCTPPVLRSLAFTRAAGSGSVPESLVRGLLQHMDLSHVWKVRGCEGLPPHFWASCVEASRWRSLFNLNLSSCGLTALPAAVGQLAPLHVLRLNHNKLTSLPPELGLLSELEVLWCNHNGLTTLPGARRGGRWGRSASPSQSRSSSSSTTVTRTPCALTLQPAHPCHTRARAHRQRSCASALRCASCTWSTTAWPRPCWTSHTRQRWSPCRWGRCARGAAAVAEQLGACRRVCVSCA